LKRRFAVVWADVDLREIESVSIAISVESDRYPPEHMKLTGL